jgi:hypothetical protein
VLNQLELCRHDEADRAADQATLSGVFAQNSQQSSLKAAEWAAQDEDIPVDGQLYSARHYAIKALRSRGGLNLIAIISGDDGCPKVGDEPGDCTAPDYRNPSERFPSRTNFPGDYFVISAPGNMNLKDPENPLAPAAPAPVGINDFVIYLPDVNDGGGSPIVGEGWYKQESLAGGAISAGDVNFNDTSTISKGVSVQLFNEALDAEVVRLDGSALMTGNQEIRNTDPRFSLRRQGATDSAIYELRDTAGILVGAVQLNSDDVVSIARFNPADGTQLTRLTIGASGNVTINGQPINGNDLTTKSYVDGNPTMTRTGDRLDITNVSEV